MNTRLRSLRAGRLRKWGAGFLMVGCLPTAASDGPDTTPVGPRPNAEIRLFVPAVARVPGAALPIAVEVSGASASLPERACVALRGEPGAVEFAFPGPCSDESDTAASAAGGGSEPGTGQTCVATSIKAGEAQRTGSVLAVYHPKATEAVVTLFGALYGGPSCEGASLAETTLVVRMVTETPSGAAGSPEPQAGAGGVTDGGTGGSGGAGAGGSGGAAAGGSGGTDAGGQPLGGAAGETPNGGVPASGQGGQP